MKTEIHAAVEVKLVTIDDDVMERFSFVTESIGGDFVVDDASSVLSVMDMDDLYGNERSKRNQTLKETIGNIRTNRQVVMSTLPMMVGERMLRLLSILSIGHRHWTWFC